MELHVRRSPLWSTVLEPKLRTAVGRRIVCHVEPHKPVLPLDNPALSWVRSSAPALDCSSGGLARGRDGPRRCALKRINPRPRAPVFTRIFGSAGAGLLLCFALYHQGALPFMSGRVRLARLAPLTPGPAPPEPGPLLGGQAPATVGPRREWLGSRLAAPGCIGLFCSGRWPYPSEPPGSSLRA